MYIPKTEGNFFSSDKSMVKGYLYSVIHLAQDRTEQKIFEMLEILDFFYRFFKTISIYKILEMRSGASHPFPERSFFVVAQMPCRMQTDFCATQMRKRDICTIFQSQIMLQGIAAHFVGQQG